WQHVQLLPPYPLPGSSSKITLRLSTPLDYVSISSLRLSVFKAVAPDVAELFVTRSREIISRRGSMGSRVVVAVLDGEVVGSGEVSTHE
ncbi:hypothetical protein TrRE_jg882, partial [Triparma retinervis]